MCIAGFAAFPQPAWSDSADAKTDVEAEAQVEADTESEASETAEPLPPAESNPQATELVPPAAEPLVFDEVRYEVFSDERPVPLSFSVEEPGFVTVLAVAETDADARLLVADDLGQLMHEGWIDEDPIDAPGGEAGVVALPRPGNYFLILTTLEDQAGAYVKASFSPMQGLLDRPDPQGRPDEAVPVKVGIKAQGSLDPSVGDIRDWFVYRATRNGVLQFRVRGEKGTEVDLILEAFDAREFWDSLVGIDWDNDEEPDEESIEVAIKKGEAVYVRVRTWTNGNASDYTLWTRWAK